MWVINDPNDLDVVQSVFRNSCIVGRRNEYTIKKVDTQGTVKYGAFDNEVLVSYFWTIKQSKPNVIMTYDFRTRPSYIRRGLGLMLFTQAIIEDGHEVITDIEYTYAGQMFWEKLVTNPLFKTGMINIDTYDITYCIDKCVLHGNDHMRYYVRSGI